MAFKSSFDDESVKIVLNKNQQFLKDVDSAIKRAHGNDRELIRLSAARKDVIGRLTTEEIEEYNKSLISHGISADQMAKDLAEMEMNREKNSI